MSVVTWGLIITVALLGSAGVMALLIAVGGCDHTMYRQRTGGYLFWSCRCGLRFYR